MERRHFCVDPITAKGNLETEPERYPSSSCLCIGVTQSRSHPSDESSMTSFFELVKKLRADGRLFQARAQRASLLQARMLRIGGSGFRSTFSATALYLLPQDLLCLCLSLDSARESRCFQDAETRSRETTMTWTLDAFRAQCTQHRTNTIHGFAARMLPLKNDMHRRPQEH